MPFAVSVPPPGSVASSAICAGPRAGHPAFFTVSPIPVSASRAVGVTVPSSTVSVPSWTRSSPMLTSVAGGGAGAPATRSPPAERGINSWRSAIPPAASRATVAHGLRRFREPTARREGHW